MKIGILILLLLAWTPGFSQLEFSLSIHDSVFLVDEPIGLEAKLIHKGSAPKLLFNNFRFLGQSIYLALRTGDSVLKFNGLITSGSEAKSMIGSDDSIKRYANLLDFFGQKLGGPSLANSLAPGQYLLQARNYQDRDTLRSQEYQFTILSPTDRDSVMHLLLLEARKSYTQRNNLRSKFLLDSLVRHDPNSPYAAQAAFEAILLSARSQKGYQKYEEVRRLRDFIHAFPESSYCVDVVQKLMLWYVREGDEDAARDEVEEIADKLEGTLAGEAARQLLSE